MSQPDESNNDTQQGRRQPPAPYPSIFAVPTPIKQLFDRFPLLTYPTNDLPHRAPRNRHAHILYVYSSAERAQKGLPSYNPACLKWQVKVSNTAYQLSSNHFTGVPQILKDRLWDSAIEQSCLAERVPTICHSCLTRTTQAHTASTFRKAAEVGYEQQQEGNRRAWRLAIRSLPVTSRSSDTEGMGMLSGETIPCLY